MKKIIFIVYFLFLFINVFSQDTVEIINNFNESDFWKIQEKFTITIPDSLKNGTYTSYFKSGVIESKGNYKNNKRIGVWEFYDSKSWRMYLKYDFDKKTILYREQTTFEKEGNAIYKDKIGNSFKVDYSPIIPEFEPNGLYKLAQYAILEIIKKFPLRDTIIKTNFNFTIKNDGTYFNDNLGWFTIPYQINNGVILFEPFITGTNRIYNKYELEILKILESYKWIPAMVNNKNIEINIGIMPMHIEYKQ